MKHNGVLELTHPMFGCTLQHDRCSGRWKSNHANYSVFFSLSHYVRSFDNLCICHIFCFIDGFNYLLVVVNDFDWEPHGCT